VRASTPCKVGRMRSELSALRVPAQVYCLRSDQGERHSESDAPRYPTFPGPPQVVSALDATSNDACSTGSNHTVDQLDEGGPNAAWGGGVALLSPLADNGSAGQRPPSHVST
jgi:Bacterial capsule synthesis protein PGA_cap